jgi:DNA-binding PadR family transcriptional regulator
MAAKRPRVLTLSAKESLILQLLARHDDAYGLELVSASRGRLKRGTVYVTLGRMEEKRYVASRLVDAPSEAGGLPRRIYQASPLGRQVLEAWSQPAKFLIPAVTR